MQEIFIESGNLVPKEEWERRIRSLRILSEKEKPISNKEDAIEIVKFGIEDSVTKRLPEKPFGIMFSGGVDSSLIAFLCKKYGKEFTCYTAGIEGSKDIEFSKIAAKELGLNHKLKVFSLDEIEHIIQKVLPLLKSKDVVNLGVASVVYAVVEMAKKDRISILFSGLGSEEIFAGYQRHELAKDVNEECWNGLLGMWSRDLVRDCALASRTGTSFITPFMDDGLIVASMRISSKLKISKSEKKLILREAAQSLGIPKNIAFRKKVAAQYGSGFDSALEKISRKKGFKFKSDFVRSLRSA